MFRFLGQLAARRWPFVLLGWVALLVGVQWVSPAWHDVVDDSEFGYIPEEFESRQGERLFKRSFSRDLLGSSVVIILRQENDPRGLRPRDLRFIREVLRPELETIQQQVVVPAEESDTGRAEKVITRIRTLDDPAIGDLLISEDGRATLVILELRTELFMTRNRDVIQRIQDLVSRNGRLRTTADSSRRIPVGLDVSVSGTATVGHDMRIAAEESASATHKVTLILVVLLLLLIYRAPLLVLIPVTAVAVSVAISLNLLAMLGAEGWLRLFTDIEIYVQVVMYGAGVDYCMFLMARYKEELDAGLSFDEAVAVAVEKVGAALAASAGTTMAGIGMMYFARFGKFSQAGLIISLSLVFVLAAALTLAPAMLRLFGRWAFWPQVRTERITRAGGWLSPTSLIARLMQSGIFRGLWEKMGRFLQARPGTIWLSAIGILLPFALVGLWKHDHLSYGLLSELPDDKPSVVGTKAVQQHFPAGATGPVTILLHTPHVRFARETDNGRMADPHGLSLLRILTERLAAQREELGIADVRSLSRPLGITAAAARASRREKERMEQLRQTKLEEELEKERKKRNIPARGLSYGLFRRKFVQAFNPRFEEEYNRRMEEEKLAYYVSDKGQLAGHVTRLDIVFREDPFSRDMLDRLDETKQTVHQLLPPELKQEARLYFIGPTASIFDLKTVTNGDRRRIYTLATLAVFLVLLALLKRPAISAYLIVSVLFSFLVSLGATFVLFWMLDPVHFGGLDWKVPVFLFTILIAVGEDYNIYLMTRIQEEQHKWGALQGISVALTRTGSIISGCGIIMAGTFSSLLSGHLAGMQQLGFALAFGVLLDTFVVRPVLVPAWLLMVHSGRFGVLSRFLGATAVEPFAGETHATTADRPFPSSSAGSVTPASETVTSPVSEASVSGPTPQASPPEAMNRM